MPKIVKKISLNLLKLFGENCRLFFPGTVNNIVTYHESFVPVFDLLFRKTRFV